MKRIGIYLAVTLAFAIGSIEMNRAHASEQITGNEVVVKDRVVEEDLLATGATVQISSEVKGDLTAAGSNVAVSAPVAGYVMAAGSNVTVSSSVGNDLWAAGSVVTVNGAVGDNAMLAGGTVNLQPGASVNSDASIAGGTIKVHGRIGRDLRLAGGNVEIASEVAGNVDASVGRLVVMPGAIIRGNLIVTGANPPEISPQAQILGTTEFRPTDQGGGWLNWLYWWLYYFLALLLTGFAFLLLSKVWANRVAATIAARPLYTLLAGFLGLLLTPVLIAVLAVTLIGIPLALILLAFYCVFLLLSCVFAAYFVGGVLLGLIRGEDASPWLRMLVGSLVVSLAVSLPWIGLLAQAAVLIFGFGAFMLERWDLRQQLRSEGQA